MTTYTFTPNQVVQFGFALSSALYLVANIYFWLRSRAAAADKVTAEYLGDCDAAGAYHSPAAAASLSLSSGDSYVGCFSHGQFHGEGEYKFASGVTVAGVFDQGAIAGRGTELFPTGAWYRGPFVNARRDTSLSQQQSNSASNKTNSSKQVTVPGGSSSGATAAGAVLATGPEGRWAATTGAFHKGLRDGPCVTWLRDGSRRECVYAAGVLHGPAVLRLAAPATAAVPANAVLPQAQAQHAASDSIDESATVTASASASATAAAVQEAYAGAVVIVERWVKGRKVWEMPVPSGDSADVAAALAQMPTNAQLAAMSKVST